MYILSEGRKDYLDFLRNLTPQGILLAFTAVAKMRLSPTWYYLDNLPASIMLVTFFAMFLMSVWANTSLFMESFLNSNILLKTNSAELKEQGYKGFKYLWMRLAFAFKNEKLVLFEAVILYVIIEFSFVVTVLGATTSAQGLLNVVSHKGV